MKVRLLCGSTCGDDSNGTIILEGVSGVPHEDFASIIETALLIAKDDPEAIMMLERRLADKTAGTVKQTEGQ